MTRGSHPDKTISLDVINLDGANSTIANSVGPGIIPFKTNATAYNKNDRFVYGVNFPGVFTDDPNNFKKVVQIKSNGEVNEVVDIDNALVAKGYPQLSATNSASSIYTRIHAPSGGVYNNKYYIVLSPVTYGSDFPRDNDYEGYLLKIDLTTFELESVTEMTYTNFVSGPTGRTGIGGPLFGDIAINGNGQTYAFDRISEKMTTIDLSSGQITTFGPDYSTMAEKFIGGAAMFDIAGNLYMMGANDATTYKFMDTLYQVDVSTGTLTAILTDEQSDIADGASCTES